MPISPGPNQESAQRLSGAESDEATTPEAPPERRQALRFPPEALPGLGSVELFPRNPAVLVNISSHGVLVSCTRPLTPSAETQLVLRGAGDEIVSGRVVRCQVMAVGDQGVHYVAAIQYDRALDLDRYVATMLATSPTLDRRWRSATGSLERLRLGPDPEMLTISELSEGGCFVQRPNRFDSGDEVELALALPTGGQVALTGEVLGADPELGFAMRFVRVGDEQQEQLRHAVALVSASPDARLQFSELGPSAPPSPNNNW